MYTGTCHLSAGASAGHLEDIGAVQLQVIYDDDVYGARIMAFNDEESYVCNHLIAIQTELTIEAADAGSWSAMDFSTESPAYTHFRATFDSAADMDEFKDVFFEGKELAEQAEIVELPNSDEPQYYGQGAEN